MDRQMENQYLVLALLEDSDPELSSPDLPVDIIAADGHLVPLLHAYGDHAPLLRDLGHDALFAANGDLEALLRFDVHFAPHRLANLDVAALVFANGDVAALLAAKGDHTPLLRAYGCVAPLLHVDRELQLAGLIAANGDVAALLAAAGASLTAPDGSLGQLPHGGPLCKATTNGHLSLDALLASNGDLPSLLAAPGGSLVKLLHEDGDLAFADSNENVKSGFVELDPEERPWVRVKPSHLSRKMRGLSPERDLTSPHDEIIPLPELEWLPKSGQRRAIRKWAQVRRGGITGTLDGLATLCYPLIIPARERN